MLLPNLPPPEEGVRHRQCNTQAFMNARPLGSGTLYIAESRVSWAKDGADGGFSLEYPHIAIHAVSRDVSSFAHPCLYLMVDAKLEDSQAVTPNGVEGSDSEEEDDETAMTEVRFVPTDQFSLEPMYKALNDCQLLHPDPEDVQSDENVGEEDDDDEGEYDVSENGYHMYGSHETTLEGEPSLVTPGGSHEARNGDLEDDEAMETGQFDDADM
ncbi:methylosome subunit pICln-like isoform X2 [Homarus americanus]|uniref:methylosome subunit pICln-like isoform X2 n=1 Tax=Homarus americanus TaxID=6706 RepID=UPI001C4746AA|nr:methylosome subunit pICln-like isoform X2 [Homarus americanus]